MTEIVVTDEMVEAVAKPIYDAAEGPVANQDFGRQCRAWDAAKEVARAALTAVLPLIGEECSKVADQKRTDYLQKSGERQGPYETYMLSRATAAQEIATAIRKATGAGR